MGHRSGRAPWVVTSVGSRCIGKGCDEVGRPGSFPEEFAVRAVAEYGGLCIGQSVVGGGVPVVVQYGPGVGGDGLG